MTLGKRPLSSQRKFVCNWLFTLKALLAIVLGSLALAFNGFKVYDSYTKAMAILEQRLTAVIIDPTKCLASRNGLARLEPERNSIMFGFHYDWIIDTPVTLPPKLGFNPAVS